VYAQEEPNSPLYRYYVEHGIIPSSPSPEGGGGGHDENPIANENIPLVVNRTIVRSMDHNCDKGKTDDILLTVVDAHNNNLTLWCKRLPTLTPPDTRPNDISNHSRQFIGYYNGEIIVGLCPFDEGVNKWGWTIDKDGLISHTFWVSKALNGTTLEFDLDFNRSGEGPF